LFWMGTLVLADVKKLRAEAAACDLRILQIR
jgi:hypothetical protein